MEDLADRPFLGRSKILGGEIVNSLVVNMSETSMPGSEARSSDREKCIDVAHGLAVYLIEGAREETEPVATSSNEHAENRRAKRDKIKIENNSAF